MRSRRNCLYLDWDSPVSWTHRKQQGSANNGDFECLCDCPLFLCAQYGDLERFGLSPFVQRG